MRWIHFHSEDCPNCGGACEVFTKSEDDSTVYDSEGARCVDCGLEGRTDCDDEVASIVWYDEN